MLPTELHQAYVFDLDGTIYLGDHLLPGAARLIGELRRRGIPVRFLSNNPTKDPRQYVEKLARLGLPTDISDIANTVVTTTRWLQEHHPDATLFVVGEEPLKRALAEAGFRLSDDPERIDIVIASYGMLGENAKGQLMMMAIVALLVSVGVGMLAAWLAEFQARLFYNRGNTHFDPPAAAIWIANTIIVSLANIAAPLF